ncbi:hypothetical protein KIW84_022427 [Lathyrus oleraceus]|uniref:Integrase zinc-binding domain-containing protein n=1 Tax=Pisum sativum TaxID=3888 RepID=A0A9D4YD47_PEA|nr:hypothetical protein KIW84_022427 [Pisum sativum]
MKSLGPILTDYNDLSMKFLKNGKMIELRGERDGGLHLITAQQVRRLLHTKGASAFFHIQVLQPEPPSTQISDPKLQTLLHKYDSLFQIPSNLPPARETNHSIHLLPQAHPVNVRPYRYPYFQKHEIEKQVDTMLANGVIRPSTSPFSSLYRSGKTNVVAYALSRIPENESPEFYMLSVPSFSFLKTLKHELSQQHEFLSKLQDITNNTEGAQDFKIIQGLIYHKYRIWLPRTTSFIKVLLEEFHKTPTGGHMGVTKTLARLSSNFTWVGMRDDVHKFVLACLDCQHSKYETKKATGLLCPLPIPHAPWED